MLRLSVGVAAGLALLVATPLSASAHVLPTTSLVLQVRDGSIEADAAIPLTDLQDASGLPLASDTDGTSEQKVSANATALRAYLLAHFAPTSDDGQAWSVTVGDLEVTSTGDSSTTGIYDALTVPFTLVPPAGASERSFNLGYDIVVHQVVTHTVLVSVGSDWAAGQVAAARELGTIALDTTTGTITPLHIDLGDASPWRGLASMVELGAEHIREGTDHQLFLLTLLLPAPLIAASGRWRAARGTRGTLRRITQITLAFTVGHSLTLALGALGVVAPQQLVEALIAVSILVAAVHALRPIFPGREALVAGGFGLVHGLAFATTLRALDLSGSQLALSLLGFNVGIEFMQLVVVGLVLPPLIVLARTRAFPALRVVGACVTAVAALGWLADRLGYPNVVGTLADGIGSVSLWLVGALWLGAGCALAAVVASRRQSGYASAQHAPPGHLDAGSGLAEVVGADPPVTRGRRDVSGTPTAVVGSGSRPVRA